MSSVNEELTAPPKHRLSPFEVRNTDLVSRLLAATPPYLYNMPLVPHSYFFSEMLRSLVQSKAEAAARMSNNIPHRRSRKRTWTQGRAEHYPHKTEPNGKIDNQEMPPPTWTPPKITTDRRIYENKPLELTMSKVNVSLNNNNITTKLDTSNDASTSRITDLPYKNIINPPTSTVTAAEKTEINTPSGHLPILFPSVPNIVSSDSHSPSSSGSSTDLILPPPPPVWYPPLYPPPYGIDPLHFFIDLRVSGHIYDRKNQSKDHPNYNITQPNIQMGSNQNTNILENSSNLSISTRNSNASTPSNVSENSSFNLLRESKHTSAFSVPTPSLNLNDPLNLTSPFQKSKHDKNDRKGRFDIKSMGFDTSTENRQSSNYILKNLVKIYSDVNDTKYKHEGIDLTSPKQSEQDETEADVKEEEGKVQDETEEEKEKKCKDLRALIGLELVVDYVNHNVKPKQCISEESSTDIDSRCSSVSAVEIVSVPDS